MSHIDIFHQIKYHAASFPDKTAIILDRNRITYADFFQKIQTYQHCFHDKPSQLIATILPNQHAFELLSIFIAATSLGHNTEVLNSDWPEEIIDTILQEQNPDLILTNAGLPIHQSAKNPAINTNTDLAFYTGFTSGSTGGPKGFVRSQQSWLDSFKADQQVFSFHKDDVIIAPGSLAHSLFFYAAIRGLYLGATIVLSRHFRPDRILKQIQDFKVTIAYMTPTQIRSIIDAVKPSDPPLNKMRLILSSGSKLPLAWLDDISSVFPMQETYEFYGTSELSYISANKLTPQSDSTNVGQAFPFVDLLILDQNKNSVPVGETGQIFVRSKFKFMGYALPNRQTDMGHCQIYQDYISIGDLGFLDKKNNLHLIGRIDRMFQSMGRNIYPEEIEKVLQSSPNLNHAAVFKEADEKRENTIAAVILKSEAPQLSNMIQYCREKLPSYSIPYRFYMIDHWPRTVSDKTDLKLLETKLAKEELEILK
ncbi:AMP-binding protein [Curvivirga sp.]|uniref:AMP-binding protein n=1 Tax=Curvivirga sp. TaxID=2856848 RepID=UPI003B5A1AAA